RTALDAGTRSVASRLYRLPAEGGLPGLVGTGDPGLPVGPPVALERAAGVCRVRRTPWLRDLPGHLCSRRAPGRAGSPLRSIGQASLSSPGRAVRGARPGRFLADCQAGPPLITHSPLPSTPAQQPFDRQPALDAHAQAPPPPRFRLGRIGFPLSAIFPPEVCFVLQGYSVGYVGKGIIYCLRQPRREDGAVNDHAHLRVQLG